MNSIFSIAVGLFSMILAGSSNSQAEQTVRTKLVLNGKQEIVAVGNCVKATKEFWMRLHSRFPYTVCQEKISEEYEVSSSGKLLDATSLKTPVPGTRVVTFELEHLEIGQSFLALGGVAAVQINLLKAESECKRLQEKFKSQMVSLENTPCGTP